MQNMDHCVMCRFGGDCPQWILAGVLAGTVPCRWGGSFAGVLLGTVPGRFLVDCAKGALRGGYRVPAEVHGGYLARWAYGTSRGAASFGDSPYQIPRAAASFGDSPYQIPCQTGGQSLCFHAGSQHLAEVCCTGVTIR